MRNVRQEAFKIYSRALHRFGPKVATKVEHLRTVGRWPRFSPPRTFNEKIQWRKIHADSAKFAALADKVLVKGHVAEKLGEDFVTPTIWSGRTLPDISMRTWNYPFVIKTNNDSGGIFIVRSQEDLDWDRIEKELSRNAQEPYFPVGFERWYDHIDRQILVEEYLGDNICDYKFYVFDGIARFVHVDTDRFSHHKRVFFDRNWSRLPISLKFPIDIRDIPRPAHLKEMLQAAELVGSGFDFVRVDFYDLPTGPRFGEMTFAPGSGYERFNPPEWDEIFGSFWTIPQTA